MRRITHVLRGAAIAALTSALLTSCGGGGAAARAELVYEPAPGDGSTMIARKTRGHTDGTIKCLASIDRNTKSRFKFDVAKKFKVIPVYLQFDHVSADGAIASLSRSELSPVLFLENGSTLEPADFEELRKKAPKKHAATFVEESFQGETLQAGQLAVNGYVYFELPKGGDFDGEELTVVGADGVAYRVDVGRSTLRFRYERSVDGRRSERVMYVGVE